MPAPAEPLRDPEPRPAQPPVQPRPQGPPPTRTASSPERRSEPPRPKKASAAAPATVAVKRKLITPAGVFAVLAALALYVGWQFPTQRYITPERGLGYALGITGGSLMLLLLLYSARKHFRWLGFLGSVARWFRFHMVLGILGPICILYHSNFG